MTNVIEVDNLGKKYVLSHQRERYTALRDVITNRATTWGKRILNPFSQSYSSHPTQEEFWALKDVSFNIKRGDRVGIIGRNGAGKSTLLKVLSRITEPTTGRIILRGRIASLLEVGTGFHPELTGRENIYLNGAILGMTKTEIKNKFDEIVEFADVEKFLDTPVKRYSSGMYVRLAFAVAAHLEPEVLIIDEVLAVGDAEFQKKCLGKMEEVGREGRTVLFVSHNMNAVRQLCNKGILLEGGQVSSISDTSSVVAEYVRNKGADKAVIDLSGYRSEYGNGEVDVLSVELVNAVGGLFAICWDEPIILKITLKFNTELSNVSLGIGCKTVDHIPLFTVRTGDQENVEGRDSFGIVGIKEVKVRIDHNLRAGFYNLIFGVSTGNFSYYYNPSIAQLEVLNIGRENYPDKNNGLVNCPSKWELL